MEAKALATAADSARFASRCTLHGLPVSLGDLCDIADWSAAGSKSVREAVTRDVQHRSSTSPAAPGKLHMALSRLRRLGHQSARLGAVESLGPGNPLPGSKCRAALAAVAGGWRCRIGSDTGVWRRHPLAWFFNGLGRLKVTFGRIGLSGTDAAQLGCPDRSGRQRCDRDRARCQSRAAAPDPRSDDAWLSRPVISASHPAGSIEGMRGGGCPDRALPDPRRMARRQRAWQMKPAGLSRAWGATSRPCPSALILTVALAGQKSRSYRFGGLRRLPDGIEGHAQGDRTGAAGRAPRPPRTFAAPTPRKCAPWRTGGAPSPSG